jgi:hypothetical protein
MSCPTGDLVTGATKPTSMGLAVDEVAAFVKLAVTPVDVKIIRAITNANIFFCIPSILSFFFSISSLTVNKTN